MGAAQDALDLARWQFAITTVYHFLFVPLTISLAFIVAGFQTAWFRSGNEKYLGLTRFYGELFLINFAIGVVTGIVQEFQFGMNWSDYSRFVGDIFGAPLAIEGLLAFFLESTFLGPWIFGWERLPRRVHLACIWIVAVATAISTYIILAANAWMQHPVGFAVNQAPELERLAAKYEGVVDLVKVDVDANPMLSAAFGIQSIPTIAFFRQGEPPGGILGFMPMEQIECAFDLADIVVRPAVGAEIPDEPGR